MMRQLCRGEYIEYHDGTYERKKFENGIFHQWGVDYEELGDSVGVFSTAIVELPDGKIITPAASMIQFTGTIERIEDRMVGYLCQRS